MSALDTAKEIIRIGSTAGLGKDVIDLLEKKTNLLAEQVAVLDAENTQLRSEVLHLRQQLQRNQPPDSLSRETVDILKYIFDLGQDVTIEYIAQRFSLQLSVAQFRFEELIKRRFVRQTRFGFGNSSGGFGLTHEGRAYVMQNRT